MDDNNGSDPEPQPRSDASVGNPNPPGQSVPPRIPAEDLDDLHRRMNWFHQTPEQRQYEVERTREAKYVFNALGQLFRYAGGEGALIERTHHKSPEILLDVAQTCLVDASVYQESYMQQTCLGLADTLIALANAKMTAQQHVCGHGTRGWCPYCARDIQDNKNI